MEYCNYNLSTISKKKWYTTEIAFWQNPVNIDKLIHNKHIMFKASQFLLVRLYYKYPKG